MGRTSSTNPTFSCSKSAYRNIPCTVYIFKDFTGGTYLPACLPACLPTLKLLFVLPITCICNQYAFHSLQFLWVNFSNMITLWSHQIEHNKKNWVKSVFRLIPLETMYRVLTFDVTTAAWQALGYLVVSRESMEAFAVGGMRMAFRAKLAVENKNPLLSDFKVGDDIVIKDYINNIKEQANEKGRNLRKMAMKV